MKLIQFKESASQRVYEAYMLRCKRATRLLPARDSEEVLMEINSHIFEHMSAHPAVAEIDPLLDVLDRLGAPEETLRAIVADKKMAQATRSFNPVHLLQALALNIGNGFMYVLLFILMLFLASFPLLAVLKILRPERVGLFTKDDGGFSFGFADHPDQQHERLGGWFIPVMLVSALVLYYAIVLLIKWTRQIKEQKIRLKTSLVVLLCLLGTASGFSQGVTGEWRGKLKAGALELRIVFHIAGAGDRFSGTMDSPDQGARGIVLSAVTYAHDTLRMALQSAQFTYTGVLQLDSVIIGTLEQGGQSFPLTLSRPTGVSLAARKPQDPVPPYPYLSEPVHFNNERDHIEFAGTFTLPAKGAHFPAVVLVTGSGPQNRDEELLGHRPFLVLSDYLTRHGIAVLRFDDRGVAGSQGVFSTATTLDFSYDAEAALQYLRNRPEINAGRIGLVGHSEGGLIAPMIAARSTAVAFIVLLAGPGLRGDSLLLLQQTLIAKASGLPDSTLKKAAALNRGALAIAAGPGDSVHVRQALKAYLATFLQKGNSDMIPPGTSDTSFVNSQIKTLMSPWMQYFLRYDPVPALEKVHCPVLAIGGDKDLQVPAAINLHLIQMALTAGHNKHATITQLPGLNHLFQSASTGSPDEYATIEETFSPTALTLVTDWILRQ